jgi:hypothetical protein
MCNIPTFRLRASLVTTAIWFEGIPWAPVDVRVEIRCVCSIADSSRQECVGAMLEALGHRCSKVQDSVCALTFPFGFLSGKLVELSVTIAFATIVPAFVEENASHLSRIEWTPLVNIFLSLCNLVASLRRSQSCSELLETHTKISSPDITKNYLA